MSDYLLKVKVQNNKIVSLMKRNNIESVAELARLSNIGMGLLHGLINMTQSPLMQHGILGKTGKGYNGDGLWRKHVLNLANFFGVLPDEMFNEQQLTSPLKDNKAERTIEFDQLLAMMGPKPDLLEDESRFEDEKKKIIDEALNSLSPRKKKILIRKFGLDGEDPLTLRDIGVNEAISSCRVGQLEKQALRTLRSPKHADKLSDLREEKNYDCESFEYKNKITFILKDDQKKLLIKAGDKWPSIAFEYKMHRPSVGKFIDELAESKKLKGYNV